MPEPALPGFFLRPGEKTRSLRFGWMVETDFCIHSPTLEDRMSEGFL
jgi:hypothetical protein